MTDSARPKQGPTTALCSSSPTDILIRGKSLPRELIGKVTFTEMIWFQLLGTEPSEAQRALLDASLVTLMEHGLTPTAVAARMTYTSAPEAMQGAVAAGLLSVGSLFVGTMEGCGKLLTRIASSDDQETEALDIVSEARARKERLPGLGHPVHRPTDPRTEALFALAREHGAFGDHCCALEALAKAASEALGRPLPPNATGAIAAVMLDAGVPAEILRGLALISRCAGLVGHIREEQQTPAMGAMWAAAEEAVPYRTDDG